MKKHLLLLLGIFLSASLNAQLLWEISGNGLAKPSYLYGTVHVGDDRAYTFIDKLQPYFDKCEVIAGELVIDKPDMMETFSLMMGMIMQNDTTLKDLLKPKQYTYVKSRLDESLNSTGMGTLSMFIERVKPIFISIILTDLGSADPSVAKKPALDMYLHQQ